MTKWKVFDGHNDVLLRLYEKNSHHAIFDFLHGDGEGHLDFPRMKQGGFAGGIFAVYIPNESEIDHLNDLMRGETFDVPLAQAINFTDATPVAMAMVATLLQIEKKSQGQFKICRDAAEIRSCAAQDMIAAVLHMEGAEAIDAGFDALEVYYAAGLRSLGPVWSRPNIFGHGVPFKFPSTGDTGPGLTDMGKALVRECVAMGIAIDLSHITEQGFWDVAKISDKPLIASHSNPYAMCKSSRNLSNRQLDAIAERGGIVGLNFATCFLNEDGQGDTPTSLETMLRHLDYLIEKLGVDNVGFGSDFDGADVSDEIGDVAGLPNLLSAMERHGYDQVTMQKITLENWINVLEKCWVKPAPTAPGRSAWLPWPA
jgi:membrane dipeptidase